MNRTAKGVGGGSDTSEKMNTMMSVIGSIAHVPGVSYTTKLAKIGLGMVKNLNQEETSDFIAKRLYDPDIAKIIETVIHRLALFQLNLLIVLTFELTKRSMIPIDAIISKFEI